MAALAAAPIEEHWDFATFVEMAGDDRRACVIADGRVRVSASLIRVVCLADLPVSRGCHTSPIEVPATR